MCSPPCCTMNERVHDQSFLGLLTLVGLVSLSVHTSGPGAGTLTMHVAKDIIDDLRSGSARTSKRPPIATLSRGVCADRSHSRDVAVDHLTGKYRLVRAKLRSSTATTRTRFTVRVPC